jgi:hypothetical protein
MKLYKTIILPIILYGCGTWPLTLRKEHSLRVLENRMLRRIFGEINAYKILVKKPEWKRPLKRPRRKWEDSIRNLREVI